MNTFEQKLREAKTSFDERAKEHQGYKSKAMIEVLAYNKQAKAENSEKYSYNSAIVDYICAKETIPSDLIDYLDTEVYLSQQDLRAELKASRDSGMVAEGWLVIPKVHYAELFTYRGKAVIKATKSNDWTTNRIETEGKIITAGNGEPFFVPKGKRTRGYYFQLLEGYYKPLN